MDLEKKPKRPRISVATGAPLTEKTEADKQYEKVNYPSGEGVQRQTEGYQPRQYNNQGNYQPRQYQPRQYNNQGSYQPRQYNNQGGYQPRQYNNQGGYNQNRYNNNQTYNRNHEGSDNNEEQQSGYQPRQYQRPYQPRQYNNQNGYNQNRQYNNRGGYQQRQYNNNREGGYNQNRQYYNQDGYNQNRQGGYNQNRQGSYNQNRQGSYNQNRQNGFQPRRYNNQGGGYNRYNNQGGYQNNHGFQNRYNNRPNNRPQRPRQIDYVLEDIDPNEPIRLNKYLANAGLCSRREADEYILEGLIKVNGEVITELGTKISRSDVVEYKDEVVTPERKCYVLLNKPKDCVTTSDDPNGRTTVLDLVKNACRERIYPVGRLDRNTTGVLLLTNDGDLASKLTHPKYVKMKIYHVWLDKDISEEELQKIQQGIELEDGEIHADEISYASDTDRNQVGIKIHSGRNRIVRRIFEALGYRVVKLDRVYFAGLTKKNLPRGRWRYLTQDEVNYLRMGSFE